MSMKNKIIIKKKNQREWGLVVIFVFRDADSLNKDQRASKGKTEENRWGRHLTGTYSKWMKDEKTVNICYETFSYKWQIRNSGRVFPSENLIELYSEDPSGLRIKISKKGRTPKTQKFQMW
jgi:hypothetical protein